MSLRSAPSRLHIKHLIGFKCHQREREMKEDGGGGGGTREICEGGCSEERRAKEACGGRSTWNQMRGNQGDEETATGEEDVRDERKSRGNREVKGAEQASCLTLSAPDCTRRTPTKSQPIEGDARVY